MSKPPANRLFFDIETSPNIGLFWESGYQISVPSENIINERSVICICWKWSGEKKVHSLAWDNNQSDKEMIENFIPIMNDASEVVAHNGNQFDIKWLRTRCIKHGIPMMPNYTSLDTLKLAQKRFKFNSNRLDYISQFLGLGNKIKTDYDLWKKVLLDNDRKALKQMIVYCKKDVILLEKIWNKLNPYVLASTNYARYTDQCPECSSSKVHIKGYRITASGYRKVQSQCQDCGKYFTMAESRFKKGKKI